MGSEVITHRFAGLTLIERIEDLPRPCKMHVALVELKTPGLRFRLTPPGGTRESLRQTTLSFLKAQHAQLAINAHFFLPFAITDPNANVVGFAASDGVIYSPFEPQPVSGEFFDQGYAIVPFAPAINIDRTNSVSIIHLDPSFSDGKHVLEMVEIWTAFSGCAQIISDGIITIPTYSGPQPLKELNGYSDANSWYAALRGRTAVGITASKDELVLFIAEENSDFSGLSVYEVAEILNADYHVFNAVNLDGDGSSSLAVEEPSGEGRSLVPSEAGGPLAKAVGSNLAVFAPPFPMPDSLSISLTANGTFVFCWQTPPAWHLERCSSLSLGDWELVQGETHLNDVSSIEILASTTAAFFRMSR